ncbi:MAG: hypothetical protein IPM98_13910 [Lewinellaceae bacterium]|nr:hypothetical protein [Lewinellaceae bacterium]
MTDYAIGVTPFHWMEWAGATDLLVHANVEFGVLQSNGDCINIGICRITTTHFNDRLAMRAKRRRCPVAAAELCVSPQGHLQAFFPKAGMLPCTERAFFRMPVFPVPVAYFLPDAVRDRLSGLQQGIIPAGLYPIRRCDEGYWITFC